MIRPTIQLTAVVLGTLLASCSTAEEAASEAAQPAETASLTISLTGIETPSGTIRIGLFAGQEDYEGGPGLTGALVPVEGETASVTLEGLAPGAYGIKLFHDVNDNGEMDTNPFGMPVEPYAFSNNAPARFGPATWDAASFEIALGENTQDIEIGG